MKKQLLVTLTALATGLLFLQSCNTKETTPSRGESEFVEVTLNLDEAETKTINAQEKTLWAENDRLTAILASCGDQDYTASYLTYRGNNTFGGRVTYPSDDNDWYLIYPYREDNVSPHKTHITVSSELKQDGNGSMAHIAGPRFPLTGKAFDLTRGGAIEVQMRNVLSHMVFQVTNTLEDPIVVKQVVFSTSKNISGDFVGDMTNDNISWTAESGASKSVTLNVLEGAQIAKDETAEFHSGILPVVESGDDMKVKIVAVHPSAPQTEIVYYKTYKSDKHLVPNKNYTFNNLNVDTAHSNDPLPGLEDPDEPSQPDQPGQPDDPTPSGESAYVKVTSEPTTWDGTYLIVDESSSKAFAAFSGNASSYAVNVTISDGKIAATSDVAKYAFTISDAGVNHENSNFSGQRAYNLRNSDGKYIFGSSSSVYIGDTNQKASQSSSSSTMNTYYSVFKYSDGGVQAASAVQSSGSYTYYLGYSGSAFGYSGGDNVSSSDKSRRVQLYKYTEGGTTPTDPTKTDQTLSFASSTVTWTIGNGYSVGSSYAAQSVSGAKTTVTYTSSNTNVATVSGNNLVIVGAGTTTITANAAASDQYNAASLSYTLTINSSGSTPTSNQRTYTYQSSVSAGTYLLGGYESSGSQYSIALFPTVLTGNWESSQGTVTNGQYLGQRDIDSSNTLTFTDDTEIFNAEVELIASGNNWKIKVKSTGEYLGVPTTDNRIVYTSSESSATAFSISGTSGYGTSGNGMGVSSGSYYFYHSGSAKGFSMRAYQVTNIRLYKLTSEGGSSSQQDQPLNFNQSSVSISMNAYPAGSTYTGQSVTGAVGNVTYTSSNTNVAEVSGNGSNPSFIIKGAGTTTITANAAASGNYKATSRSYTLTVTSSTTPSTGDATYVKATSLTVGETYLITSVDDTKLFKGASDGSYVTINASSGVITDANNAYSGYEFRITQSGSKYCLIFNDGKYLICDYSTSGNSTTGLVFESSKPSDEYLYSYSVNNGVFEFMTAQRNSTSTEEVLYYKTSSMSGSGQDKFKIGASGKGVGVHLFLKTSSGSSKKTQSPYFSTGTVTQTKETASGTMQVQTVQNAIGNVTYTSSNTNVATISGNIITIKGFGTTTITANAEGNDEYYPGSASYTLTINRVQQEGVFNLENDCVYNYLNEATSSYTAENHSSTTLIKSNGGWTWGGGSSSSGVYSFGGVNYTPSSSNRWDCPKPVTITWSTPLSGNKDVYIYTDAAHTQLVNYIDNPISVSSSSNSVEVFNLIPEQAGNRITYYYTVMSSGSQVASGEITTEGRRRMMKISSTYSENNANNCRDFGGQVTTSGKHIKFGKMYRGSNMDNTTSNEQKIIKQYMNIGLDVDLRGSSERNNPLGFTQISTYDADTYRGHTQESYSGTSDLNNSQNMGATLKRVMNAVVNDVNVYIHCRVGADRTGYTCMMLEAILGVPLERCDMDYEMTSFSVVGTRIRTGDSVNYYHSGVSQINNQSGSTYQEKAINYAVNTLGISRDLITQFQNKMLE